jgi:hypothetical protein
MLCRRVRGEPGLGGTQQVDSAEDEPQPQRKHDGGQERDDPPPQQQPEPVPTSDGTTWTSALPSAIIPTPDQRLGPAADAATAVATRQNRNPRSPMATPVATAATRVGMIGDSPWRCRASEINRMPNSGTATDIRL